MIQTYNTNIVILIVFVHNTYTPISAPTLTNTHTHTHPPTSTHPHPPIPTPTPTYTHTHPHSPTPIHILAYSNVHIAFRGSFYNRSTHWYPCLLERTPELCSRCMCPLRRLALAADFLSRS